jgi:hypothetical protein
MTSTSYGWHGEYFANVALSGTPAFVRDDANVDFDWGTSSPSPGTIGIDDFSVRWTRNVDLPAGRYRFTVTVDDGVRLWVNNHLLIESWREQPSATFSQEINLTGGQIPIKMEYYEHGGLAVAKLSWTRVTSTTNGDNWRGEYFDNVALSGTPVLTRDDAHILFDWGTGSPVPGSIPEEDFSVRWTRSVNLSSGRYRFMMTVDDGGRLWVNGKLLIDAWRDQAAHTYTAEIDLSGGAIPIKMEYYEHGGQSVARLSWEQVTGGSSTGSSAGTVVVDDTDPGFSKGGSYTGWRTAREGYGGRLLWTRNNDWQRPYYNWARWQPTLTPGRYEVFVFIPYRYTTTSNAVYSVSHSGGKTLRAVNQSTQGNHWASLGTYWFAGTSNDYVMLTDATGETRLTRLIAFDAVKWVPR